MTDYNLAGLSTRSFEQLIQAIAAKVFGPQIIIFGDGPDGGREATFEGTVPYPSREQAWNGYGVVQAKFLQRPQGAPNDGEWALQQLRDELAKFGWSPKGPRGGKPKKHRQVRSKTAQIYERRIPEYYVFVTNAVLTPVGDQGTKDKAQAILEEFKADKGLKDFDVWDYDKICAYLDGFEDIRHGYEGFITTGDVLARVVEWLRPQRPDFEQLIYRFLQAELITDQYANLEQAGRATEEKVPIARVFVDLPAYDEQVPAPPNEEISSDPQLPPGFVAEVVEAAKSRLDPVSLQSQKQPLTSLTTSPSQNNIGRLVLVGGPGQGKTTVGQFICQLFRASILKGRANWVPVREIEDILQLLATQCSAEGIELPTARRFPIRIVLSNFAKELAVPGPSSVTSVLSYIAARIKRRTDEDITPSDLRLWLKNYPWLVIFDGLDEVPASSNREDVLKAIQTFRVDINESNADVLIIATTRPQGYNEDFAPDVYQHKWLAPLSIPRALHYARRLTEIRYSADKERQERVMARLERAANSEATARLMRSPLQVTIMTTLVGTGGQPPQERWGLFNEYYKVIYQREMEREIPASDILRDYKSDIDRIHNRVGLILQTKSEHEGETDARLSKQEFTAIVADRLDEEGHEGPRRGELQRQITDAATERLVFLVGLQDELIGFEIRSLQEFMAAEALMGEGDEIVRKRLAEIAPVSNWRNVFLFAAGRCFAERQDLRDTIYTLCAELNDSVTDRVSSATLEGSKLAIDLLEDGVVRTQPKYTRLFTRLALQALNLAPSHTHTRLANLYAPELEQLYQEELTQRLELTDFHRTLGAWSCLGRLIGENFVWARSLGDLYWPSQTSQQHDVLRATSGVQDEVWRLTKLINTVPRLQPRDIVHPSRRDDGRFIFTHIKGDSAPKWFRAVMSLVHDDFTLTPSIQARVKLHGPKDSLLSCTIYKSSDGLDDWDWSEELLRISPEVSVGWKPFLAASRFLAEPTKHTLGRELRDLAGVTDFEAVKNVTNAKLPWVMAACLGFAGCRQDLELLADRAEVGELGDIEDWEAAEKRWAESGIQSKDFEFAQKISMPFDRNIGVCGFPFTAIDTWSAAHWKNVDYVLELLKLHEQLDACRIRANLAARIFFLISVGEGRTTKGPTPSPINLTSKQLITLLNDAASWKIPIHLAALDAFDWETPPDEHLIISLDQIGKTAHLFASSRLQPRLITTLSNAFTKHPDRIGLLRLLSYVLYMGGMPTVPAELLSLEQYADPEYRSSAIVTRLAQQQMTTDEAEQLALQAANDSEESWGADAVIRMVEANRLDFNATVVNTFLVTLLKKLPSTQWQKAQRTIHVLEASLKRRTSGLKEHEVWMRMGFRQTLHSLVKSNDQ